MRTVVCMRTHIVLNDDLVREAMRFAKAKTRRALVEEALRTFIEVKERERRVSDYEARLPGLDARLTGLRLRQSPADLLREDRDQR